MVAIKLCIVVLVIAVGLPYVVHANHTPFIPPNTGTFGHFGWTGVFRATGVIFFAYIGFDAVSRGGAGGARIRKRDVPIGILGSLADLHRALHADVLCADRARLLHDAERDASGVDGGGSAARPPRGWRPSSMSAPSSGWPPSCWCCLLGQSRIFYAMSQRRHDPAAVQPDSSAVHARRGAARSSPASSARCWRASCRWIFWANWFPSARCSAFVIVCVGVMVLRMTEAERQAPVPHAFRMDRRPARHRDVRLHDGCSCRSTPGCGFWCGRSSASLIYIGYSVRHAKPPRWHIEEHPARIGPEMTHDRPNARTGPSPIPSSPASII